MNWRTLILLIFVTFFSQSALSENAQFNYPDKIGELGAQYSRSYTTFSIWSPSSEKVSLSLDGQNFDLKKTAEREGLGSVYAVRVVGDWALSPYQFFVDGKSVRDPYGKMVVPDTNINIVMDLSRTEPEGGWAPLPEFSNPEDAVIWETHIADFSADVSSDIPSDKKGRYLGMVHPGSKFEGVSTGIDHLVSMGITHVQIMPFYDFSTCPDPADRSCYNWGYDPRNFNIPEERYNQSLDFPNGFLTWILPFLPSYW